MTSTVRNRVLMLVENSPYPQDIRVLQEAEALKSNGYKVSVICPAKSGQPKREILNGVSIYRYPSLSAWSNHLGYFFEYGWSLLMMSWISLQVYFSAGFDILHAANPPDTLVLIAIFYKLFGKCFIFDQHDLTPELYLARCGNRGNAIIYQILILLEKLSCHFADHVIATNQSYKALEIERGHVEARKITIVRNGPNHQLQPVEPAPGLRIPGKTTLVYVGVIGAQDGVEHLLYALNDLVCEFQQANFKCILVGDGKALPRMKVLTKELRLTDYVRFAGWVDHSLVAAYLSAADICVAPEPSNPYNDRSTIIKLMEYMALGKPTIAFNLPEHRVTAQNAAIYARANDDRDFARQICMLIDNPEQCRRMGNIGRQRVENELAWSHQIKPLLKSYEAIKTTG